MIEGLKPYAEYKGSGCDWLDGIPSHWNVVSGRACFNEIYTSNKGMVESTVLSLSYGRIVVRPVDKLHGLVPASFETYQVVEVGDIIVRPTDLQNDWNTLRTAMSPHKGIITSAYIGLRVTGNIRPDFGERLLRTYDLMKIFYGLGSGLRQNLSWSDFKSLPCLLPPPDEQAAIVRFLDHANRKIDGFIRAKRKLIGLLNEQKQAIIHHAVTRGLNPNVPLKPSGIPWLGDIPQHWDAPLLGRCLTRIEQGWSPVGAEGELGERQWCVLTLSAVRRGVFNPEAIKPVSTSADIPRDIEVANGDLLLTRSNTRERVGDVCLVKDVRHRTLLCDLIYRLSPRKSAFVPQFLVYQLLCPLGRGQIEKDARGSSGTMPKISQSHIKAWRVLLPPTNEQRAIVDYIEIESRPINTAIARTEREIALMQEYRTRLTTDLVTGKLDVREAAANLPAPPSDEPPEPAFDEPMEEIDASENEDS